MKVVWERSAVTGVEDVAITTHDFGPDVDVDAAGRAAIRTDFILFWDEIRAHWPNNVRPLEFRFYNGYNGDGSPGDVDDVLAAGLYGALTTPMLPPQCAMTVTEEVPQRRHWGRFYLPAPAAALLTDDGRFTSTVVNFVADKARDMYNAWYVDGHWPIVWRDVGGSPTQHVITPVEGIRVDDIVDIQRRRRWDAPSLRATRDLTVLP